MKNPRLVEVFWRDSAFHRGWASLRTKREEATVSICRTAGYLIEETRDQVKVSHSCDVENESFADVIAIPREAIRRVRRLR